MKNEIREKILNAINILANELNSVSISVEDFSVEVPKINSFGDYSTNAAFILSKKWGKSSKEVAKKIKRTLVKEDIFTKVEIAGNGFINFSIKEEFLFEKLKQVLVLKDNYGKNNLGDGEKILLEFVSANPTGPLHVGNGRGGIIGDVLSKVLKFCNYKVENEYYVNDAEYSGQVENLVKSVFSQIKKIKGEKVLEEPNQYKGDYIVEIAKEILQKEQLKSLILDKGNFPIPEEQLNIEIKNFALNKILLSQKEQLKNYGIDFDNFFSEQSLYANKEIQKLITLCKSKRITYNYDNALWINLTKFGSKKDEVLVRANGKPTYFAADVAYHLNKFERGYAKLVNVWGADHHGHIERIKIALSALGYDTHKLEIILYQLVKVLRDGIPLKLSKREGEMVTLEEVVNEVGKDAARFFFLMTDFSNTLDFDLEVAKKQTMDNPVYYIQYAYCRICSILEKIPESEIKKLYEETKVKIRTPKISLINEESLLLKKILNFPEEIATVAKTYTVHRLCNYGKELAALFHSFYHMCKVIGEKKEIFQRRLLIILATKIMLQNLFLLLGITPLEKM